MDLCDDTELDYEEDGLEENSQKTSENDCINKTSNTPGSDDEYLQIDFSEEENLVTDKTLVETIPVENQTIGKANEKSEKSDEQNTLPRKKQFTENKSTDNNDAGGVKSVKTLLQLEPCLKDNKTKTGTHEHSSPENNFDRSVGNSSKLPVRNGRIPKLNQSFCPNQTAAVPLLSLEVDQPLGPFMKERFQGKRSFRSNSARFPPVNSRSLRQHRNDHFGANGSNDRSKFRTEHKRTFSRNPIRKNVVESELLLKEDSIKKNRMSDKSLRPVPSQKGFCNEFQIADGRRTFRKRGFHDQKNSVPDVNLNEFGVRNYEAENEKGVFLNAKYNPLEEEERTLVQLKKEARLKRFMQEDNVRNERKFISTNSEKETHNDLQLGERFTQEIEDQKLLNENSFNGQKPKEKPHISKELLLRKRNPFAMKLEASDRATATGVKEEDGAIFHSSHSAQGELFGSGVALQRFMKKEEKEEKEEGGGGDFSENGSARECFRVVKTEADSQEVKFVRTVSKSLDELARRKGNPSPPPRRMFPLECSDLETSVFPIKDPPQMEPQLTGCIVKVLNIPPSTTTRDILALCNPIGSVVEVKLNFPKENSVVIRFAESTCAETFFSLYHGRKMSNYFLNVIVV